MLFIILFYLICGFFILFFFFERHWDLHFLHVPKNDNVGTTACAFDGKEHCLLVQSEKAQPPPDWLATVGGDRQMISVHQARSGDGWIAQNKFHMWQLVGVGITPLHWFDLIPSKKSARIISNHLFYCLFVYSICLFLLMIAHVHFPFHSFFLFSGWVCVRVCARNCNYALQWVALFPPAIKWLLYVAYWQKN